MFKTRPTRTWLTILGIGVGIAAVVVLVGLGYGLQGIMLEKIVFGEAMLSLNVTNPPSKVIVLDEKRIEELKAIANVDDVSALASFPSLITFEGLSGSILLQGVKPSYFRYAGMNPQYGEFFTGDEGGEVVLNSATLKLFGFADEEKKTEEKNDGAAEGEEKKPEPAAVKKYSEIIGKTVRFKVFVPKKDKANETDEIVIERDFKVIGVIDDAVNIAAFLPIKEFTSRFAIPYYEKARVRVTKNDFLNQVQAETEKKGFLVTALSKTVEQANKIFRGIQVMLGIFGGIALVVSAIGMFNTMTVTLLERTNEIGIMRTIGGSPRNIKVLFLAESVVMGFLGGLVGIGIGVGGGLGINFLLNQVAKKYGGAAVALFKFPLGFLFFIAAFGAVMGFLTGVFPAKRASSLSPLDAIRYK